MTKRKKLIDECIAAFASAGYTLDGYRRHKYPSMTILLGRNAFDFIDSESRSRNNSGSIEFDVIIEQKYPQSAEYPEMVAFAAELEESAVDIVLNLQKFDVTNAGKSTSRFKEFRVHETVFGFDDNTARILLQCESFFNIIRS